MAEPLTLMPPLEAIAAMNEIPGTDISPSVLVRQRGPAGGLGPERAEAILMLQATFVDEGGAANFWAAAVELMDLLATAPGFIRRYSFPDGPSITLIAFWETAQHARDFAAGPEHRAAVRALYRGRWQYSHFAALWEMTSNHGRQIFCDRCSGITEAAEGACARCGHPHHDVHAEPRSGVAAS